MSAMIGTDSDRQQQSERRHKYSGPSQGDIEASWVLGTESEWLWGSREASWVLGAESERLIGIRGGSVGHLGSFRG